MRQHDCMSTHDSANHLIPSPGTLDASLSELEHLGLVARVGTGWALGPRDLGTARRVIEEALIDDAHVEALWATYLAVPLLAILHDLLHPAVV